eukprot:TRINITY_DN10515_c0_g1_i3.p1 TRINITY_DN10515_c0_g1~~TRINITY_DN10515_c0_g1_i3.p1  ORF type:complete len:440 (+),score=90.70 TRINITY_DN10515_c0_g1_i3:376-1695(+)
MVPEFDAVCFSAPVGEVQGPVKTAFGYHLILVLDRREEEVEERETVTPTSSWRRLNPQAKGQVSPIRPVLKLATSIGRKRGVRVGAHFWHQTKKNRKQVMREGVVVRNESTRWVVHFLDGDMERWTTEELKPLVNAYDKQLAKGDEEAWKRKLGSVDRSTSAEASPERAPDISESASSSSPGSPLMRGSKSGSPGSSPGVGPSTPMMRGSRKSPGLSPKFSTPKRSAWGAAIPPPREAGSLVSSVLGELGMEAHERHEQEELEAAREAGEQVRSQGRRNSLRATAQQQVAVKAQQMGLGPTSPLSADSGWQALIKKEDTVQPKARLILKMASSKVAKSKDLLEVARQAEKERIKRERERTEYIHSLVRLQTPTPSRKQQLQDSPKHTSGMQTAQESLNSAPIPSLLMYKNLPRYHAYEEAATDAPEEGIALDFSTLIDH